MKTLLIALLILLSGCTTVEYRNGEEVLIVKAFLKKLDGATANRGDFSITLGATGTTLTLQEMAAIAAILKPTP